MVFLGGGSVTSGGISVLPISQHPDYADFLAKSEAAGWRIVAISGEDYPDYYEMVISFHAAEYAVQGGKPILVGHSVGGMVGLFYAKDRPSDSFFSTITLFNVPLIYPYTDNIPFQRVYKGTERVTADATIIMSKNDPIMAWKLGSVTMLDAVNAVQDAKKVKVQVLDITGYLHSPFSPVDVAWDILNRRELPAKLAGPEYPVKLGLKAPSPKKTKVSRVQTRV